MGEISKLITQYEAQIEYYENPKLWKTYLRSELWKFAKLKHHNHTQNDLTDHVFRGISKAIIDLVGADDAWYASEIATEVGRFTQYYTTVLFDYESYFGEMGNVPEMKDINLKDIDPSLETKLERSYTTLVT